MLKDNERLYANFFALFDVLLTIGALVLGYYIRVFTVSQKIVYSDQYITLALLIIPVWYVLINIINFQSIQKVKTYSVVFFEYAIVVLIGTLLLFVFIFLFKLDRISRLAVLIFAFTDLFLLFAARVLIYQRLKKRRLKGKGIKNALLVADKGSLGFIKKIISQKYLGFKIAGIVSEDKAVKKALEKKYDILPPETDIEKILEEEVIDEIIYCKSKADNEEIERLIHISGILGVTFQLQSDFFSFIASQAHLNYYGQTPLMTFANTPSDNLALAVKAAFEYIFSVVFLLLFSPFFLIIALAIRIESKGPVLFKQKRVGLRGRLFTMYKFRTMVNDAEKLRENLEEKNEADGPVFKIKNDPRVTKVGAFLRKTSLDEVPQFLNVLKGDMAVVGPRPPVPEEVEQYTRPQRRRLSMKPGITCIWQVSGRNEIAFEDWMKLDLQYIDNWSLKLDFLLMLKTVNAVFRRTGY